jgi:hypothetical protein
MLVLACFALACVLFMLDYPPPLLDRWLTRMYVKRYNAEMLSGAGCPCRCHSEKMFPGMVCMDCWGKPCGDPRGLMESEPGQ